MVYCYNKKLYLDFGTAIFELIAHMISDIDGYCNESEVITLVEFLTQSDTLSTNLINNQLVQYIEKTKDFIITNNGEEIHILYLNFPRQAVNLFPFIDVDITPIECISTLALDFLSQINDDISEMSLDDELEDCYPVSFLRDFFSSRPKSDDCCYMCKSDDPNEGDNAGLDGIRKCCDVCHAPVHFGCLFSWSINNLKCGHCNNFTISKITDIVYQPKNLGIKSISQVTNLSTFCAYYFNTYYLHYDCLNHDNDNQQQIGQIFKQYTNETITKNTLKNLNILISNLNS